MNTGRLKVAGPLTLEECQTCLRRYKEIYGTWRKVAFEMQVNSGWITKIMQGIEPQGEELREVFGLKPVPDIYCPECGEVHTVGWCTVKDGPPRKPAKPIDRSKAPLSSLPGKTIKELFLTRVKLSQPIK